MTFSFIRHFFVFLLLILSLVLIPSATAQNLDLREICTLDYKVDFASLLEKNKDTLFPSNTSLGAVHFYRGISYLEQHSYPEAISDFEIARTDSSVSKTFCNFYIGVAYMQLGETDSILGICSQALNVPGSELKNPYFWQNAKVTQDYIFSAYLLGTNEVLHHSNDSTLIETLLNFSIKLPEFQEAYINYSVWCYQNGNFAKAINLLNHVLEEKPKNDSALILCMGYIYRLAGDPDQSQKAYILLRSKYPRFAPGYNNLGCLFGYLDQYEKALSALTKAIRKDRALLDAWCNRGLIYLKMKKYQRAFDDFSSVIQLNANFADGYYYRGFARKALGDLAGSVQDYSRAIGLKK